MKMIENVTIEGTVKSIVAGRSCTTLVIELPDGESIEAITTNALARRKHIKMGKTVSAIIKDHKATLAA